MIRVALPRGELREPLAERLSAVGFAVRGYGEGSRSYRFSVEGRPEVMARVFADRDIAIQVALGQYDLGITSAVWVEELLSRYRHDSLVTLRSLDMGAERLVVAGPAGSSVALLAKRVVRVATRYPNLTTQYLNRLRAPDYRVYEVWDEAEAWPPEDADVAVCLERASLAEGLATMAVVQAGSARLIGNREALARAGLEQALEPLMRLPAGDAEEAVGVPRPLGDAAAGSGAAGSGAAAAERTALRVAVPNGHAQRHAVAALEAAGIVFDGYDEQQATRRPRSDLDGVEVKVLRPQDMPGAVALGLYDLALTGRDWLEAHRAAFPPSPVEELLDLGRARYRLGAVVPDDLPVETVDEAVEYWRREDPRKPIRVASEYVALADRYARERRLGRYRVIPISGASEGFVPDDAEILIEGSETGVTLRANRLRMIDVIMESTTCVIGSPEAPGGRRGALRRELVERLRAGVEASS
ncbi:MAG: ATP phosphoribosyltransferase [Dehalococcoidia bacterium]